jgi:tRNA A-37 threonylcarbamoyl transferase component Bud32
VTAHDLLTDDTRQTPQIEGFEIVGRLGAGGMGVVYKARQVTMDRMVAIKTLHAHLIGDNTNLQRFVQEGRVATAVEHPNLARVFGCGVTEDKLPYLVLEILEGKTLKDLLTESGALDAQTMRDIFIDILNGLQAAHDAGIVHRDLKPGNVMLVDAGDGKLVPKILDFGVAKFMQQAGSEQQKLTREGTILGSPAYMSPEQCWTGTIDARADIYSIGCMMYESLTGRVPFQGENALEVMTKHLNQTPAAPSTVSPKGVSAALDGIVLKCLSKEPAARFGSCRELIAALQAASLVAAAPRKGAPRGNVALVGLIAVIVAVAGALAINCNSPRPPEQHGQIATARALASQLKYTQAVAHLREIEPTALSEADRAELFDIDYRLATLFHDEGPLTWDESEHYSWVRVEHDRFKKVLRAHAASDPDIEQLRDIMQMIHGIESRSGDNVLSRYYTRRSALGQWRRKLEVLDNEPSLKQRNLLKSLVYEQLAQDERRRGAAPAADSYMALSIQEADAARNVEHQMLIRALGAGYAAEDDKTDEAKKLAGEAFNLAPQVVRADNYESAIALFALSSVYKQLGDRQRFNSLIAYLDAMEQRHLLPELLRRRVKELRS